MGGPTSPDFGTLACQARPGLGIFGWTLVIKRVQVKDHAYPRVPNQN